MDEKDIIHTADAGEKKSGGFGRRIRDGIRSQTEGLAYGGKPLFFTMILTFLVTVIACIAVFFASLQGEEKVMVPDVVGKSLTTALLEMQQKELEGIELLARAICLELDHLDGKLYVDLVENGLHDVEEMEEAGEQAEETE